jgi:branched-chain amino acid transport system permease protein
MATYLRRAYSTFATNVLDIPPRLMVFLFFLLILAYPVTRPGIAYLYILSIANVMAIFAASWDLLVGRTGQISLGHALFFGCGAYTTALLGVFFNFSVWVTIPLSMIFCVLIAFIIGFPSLRTKGPYLALVTMAVPLILEGAVIFFENVTGGDRGISNLPRFFPFLSMYESQLADFYFTLLLLAVSAIILYKIAYSRIGIVMVSILDDEAASKASGINTTKYKMLAFAISALFAGLAGSLSAHLLGTSVSYGTLDVTESFNPIIMTIWGGIGTIYGPVAAAYIITILNLPGGVLYNIFGWLSAHHLISAALVTEYSSQLYMIIFIIIVILIIVKWSGGLTRFVTDKLKDLSEERKIEERGKHIWKTYKKKSQQKE